MTTIQLYEQPVCLSLREVAEQLTNCGIYELDADEAIGECRLECGQDLAVDINKVIEGDPRCSGYHLRTEYFDIGAIRRNFTAADHYAWGKDEDGDDCLWCFGC